MIRGSFQDKDQMTIRRRVQSKSKDKDSYTVSSHTQSRTNAGDKTESMSFDKEQLHKSCEVASKPYEISRLKIKAERLKMNSQLQCSVDFTDIMTMRLQKKKTGAFIDDLMHKHYFEIRANDTAKLLRPKEATSMTESIGQEFHRIVSYPPSI